MIKNLTSWTAVCALTLLMTTSTVRAEATVPTTADQHFALSKQYAEKAAAYRKEAADHRNMASAYKGTATGGQERRGQNPWVVKMEKHCEAIASAAEKLAVEEDKAADYHKFRGKELQGK